MLDLSRAHARHSLLHCHGRGRSNPNMQLCTAGNAQVKLNTDDSPNVATEYGIRSIPTVMLFKVQGPSTARRMHAHHQLSHLHSQAGGTVPALIPVLHSLAAPAPAHACASARTHVHAASIHHRACQGA